MYLREKLKELKRYVKESEEITPTFEAYKNNLTEKAAGERYFEKIVECATDIAILVAKEHKLERPEDDAAAFETLAHHKLLRPKTAEAMQKAKSMRNFIVHRYGQVSDEKVYDALTKQLPRDVHKFIAEVEAANS